jgi:hypothetical protein
MKATDYLKTRLSKSQIIEILKKHGCKILPSELSKTLRKELMEEVFLEMYYDGKSDFAISKKLDVSATTITNLRRSMDLPPNRGKKVEGMKFYCISPYLLYEGDKCRVVEEAV